MKGPEQRTVDVDVQDVDTRGRTIVGYAAVYGAESRDLGGFTETIRPGAFSNVLPTADVRALLNHDPSQVLARTKSGTLRLFDEERGLRFEADLPDSPLGQNVREAVRRGDIDGASFRFIVGDEEWDGDRRTIVSVKELHDVTVATYGAYPDASVELRTRPNPALAEEDTMSTDARPAVEPDTEDRATAPAAGGLSVEDRAATAHQPTADERIVSAIRSVPRGENRALTTAVAVSPGELSTTLFDRLRGASVMLSTGIRVLTTDADQVTYPAITGDATADMYAEAAPITPSDPVLGSLVATPRKMASLVQASNEALEDSNPALAQVVRDHLISIMALKADQQILEGSGTAPQVRGLRNVTGIQTLAAGANGAPATFDVFAQAIALLEAQNVPLGRIAIVAHPRNVGTLRIAKASTGGTYLWGDVASASPRTVFGTRVVTSPQLSTNEVQGTSGAVTNSAFVFDVESVVFVRRTEIEIDIDRSRLFNSDQSELRGRWRFDLIVPNPSAVVRVTGLTA